MTATVVSAAKRERPMGVVIVALFLLVDSALATGQIVFDSAFSTRLQTLLDINEWMPALVMALAVARVVTAFGLWLGYRWAWVLSMLVVGTGLLFAFVVYWVGDPGYLRLLIGVVMAFYLNQGSVRDYFEGRSESVSAESGAR